MWTEFFKLFIYLGLPFIGLCVIALAIINPLIITIDEPEPRRNRRIN